MTVGLEVDEPIDGDIGGGPLYQTLLIDLMEEENVTINAMDFVASLESGKVYVALLFWVHEEKVKALLLCLEEDRSLILVKEDIYDIVPAPEKKDAFDVDYEAVTNILEAATEATLEDIEKAFAESSAGPLYFSAEAGFHHRALDDKSKGSKKVVDQDDTAAGKIELSPSGAVIAPGSAQKPSATNQGAESNTPLAGASPNEQQGQRHSARSNKQGVTKPAYFVASDSEKETLSNESAQEVEDESGDESEGDQRANALAGKEKG